MADPKLDAAIKATIGSMGKLISKPPMTKKLLSKPPFRFLFDTVMEVMKIHNIGTGLFSPEEIHPDNVKEKPAKIAFLEKIIHMTSFAVGKPLAARPSKIVAGLEPEATNAWLTALAKVAEKQIDTSEAVERVNAGEKPDKKSLTKPKEKEASKARPSGSAKRDAGEKVKRDSKDRSRPGKAHGERTKSEKDGEGRGDESADADAAANATPSSAQEESGAAGGDQGVGRQNAEQPRERERPKSRSGGRRPDRDDEQSRRRVERPSSARGRKREDHHDSTSDIQHQRSNIEDEEQEQESGAAGQLEPEQHVSSTRDNEQEEEAPMSRPPERAESRESSARASRASTARRKKTSADFMIAPEPAKEVEIIGDNDGMDDDDDDTFVVVEQKDAPTPTVPKTGGDDPDDGEHGALMRKIQEKKGDNQSTEQAVPTGNEAKRRKEQEIVAAEVEKLRESIQTLCRTANPLGKIVDFVQEDVDAMQAEMTSWQAELQKDSATLSDEAQNTDKELQPYKVKLLELDQQIRDQEDMIRAVKMNTLENEERIHKLLKGIAFAAKS